MKKIMSMFKIRWILTAMVCLIGLSTISMAGCAGSTKTSTVTTQTTNGTSDSGSTSSTTTHKEVVTDAHPTGVIGGIFYTIGQVIALPFKIIGSIL